MKMKRILILLLGLAGLCYGTTKPAAISGKNVSCFARDKNATSIVMYPLANGKVKGVSGADTVELGNTSGDGYLKINSTDKITYYCNFTKWVSTTTLDSMWVNVSLWVSPETTAFYNPVPAPNWEHQDSAASTITPPHTYTLLTDSTLNYRVMYQAVVSGGASRFAMPIPLPKGLVASRIYLVTKPRVANKSTDSFKLAERYITIERGNSK